MTVSTTRFFHNNSELFNTLNSELKSLQSQAGTGEAELKLGANVGDISKLSAAEEKKSETNQLLSNSKRVQSDIQVLDLAFERMQNLLVRLQELAVESANDTLLPEERQRFIYEADMIKSELLDVANQQDNFGNSLFGGISGIEKPFEINSVGDVQYNGSSLARELQVTPGLSVKQNLSGLDVFQAVKSENGAFSVFEVVDDLIESLGGELNSGQTSNLFNSTSSVILKFPNSGPEADISFKMEVDEKIVEISETVYGNDFSHLASIINASTAETGLSASFDGENQLTLTGTGQNLFVKDFEYDGDFSQEPKIEVLDVVDGKSLDLISVNKLQNSVITGKITDSFEHFASKRAEISASARRAQDAEIFAQDLIITLEENISEIRDADLASILTELEFLMTQKDAAQATFTRITSKSLFDFLG